MNMNMKALVVSLVVGCVATPAFGASPEGAADASGSAAPVVAIGFADALDGALWRDILEASPEQALFFVGLRYKFKDGYAVDVADWATSTQFQPTAEFVELMLSDPYSPRTAELMQPIARNQLLKVESRGQMAGEDRVRLDLTTVLETASSPTDIKETTLSSRTYYLARVDDTESTITTADGLPAAHYVLVAAEPPRQW